MSPQPMPEDPDREAKRRRADIVAFLVGAAAALAFFSFFPGLPHVIDWGAILASLAVGALTRWAWRSRLTKKRVGSR
ncbi:hypothetical protein HHL19_27955 [Streptomyces sp. R302]|uniref:hypothetical protein n=1 Tax=unclassified Streptomyces TaxID=2593676 RepID=UPI00145D3AA1|nr:MULTISPECIES: hypothetical protein [unclassified Streptomyces]NML52149.1 hypothetical protein [Streptomyces sp. R301]NML82385.1 hypothetical protein [Streptomyces sp. R302]